MNPDMVPYDKKTRVRDYQDNMRFQIIKRIDSGYSWYYSQNSNSHQMRRAWNLERAIYYE
jgi:hypothetical protein